MLQNLLKKSLKDNLAIEEMKKKIISLQYTIGILNKDRETLHNIIESLKSKRTGGQIDGFK